MDSKMNKVFALGLAATLMFAPNFAWAGEDTVPLDLPGSEGMPSAGDAQPTATAPGEPIEGGSTEAPATPNPDTIAPVEPPPP